MVSRCQNRRRIATASFVTVLLVLALGHRWSMTASWFTSGKTCGERHATPWFVERLHMDCDRLLRARLWNVTASATIAPILHGNEAVSRAVCPQGLGRDGQDWGQEGHA